MTSSRLAQLLQDQTIKACQDVDGSAPGQEAFRQLREAMTAANLALGDNAPRNWREHLKIGLTEGIQSELQDVDRMRSLLLKTRFAEEMQASGADSAAICFLVAGDPNASAFPAPDGKPIIQMEAALQSWLVFLNRILVRCGEANSDKQSRKEHFLDVIRPWTEMSFDLAEPCSARSVMESFAATCEEPLGLLLSVKITEWQMFWVLAHELAHIALGHLSETVHKSLHIGEESYDLPYFVRSHQQEYAADKRAVEYLLAVHEEITLHPDVDEVLYPEPMSSAAPCVLLMYFSYLQMLRWKPGTRWASTHPMAKDRVAAVFPFCEPHISQHMEAFALFQLAQEMTLKASYAIFDELGLARPGGLPREYEINWSLGNRID